ncbi:MAG TPA: 5'-3' exonuclease H3TH domain-containing protein [Candidatus Nitrosotenuis sp.]|nr:5'-3' exonuclease H3TH domain-containing protein [Candidatus Nitrosotenuis sp.]
MPRLYLIDILYHIHRAFFALPASLRASDGRPTNVVHGAIGILRTLWKAERPEYAVAVFEGGPTFRDDISQDYKANRAVMKPSLAAQIPLVEEACRRLGIPVLAVPGYEADDVMATLACRAGEAGVGVSIVSSDKDMAQVLAWPYDIELLRLPRGTSGKKVVIERIRRQDVERLFGVPPERIPSLLALRGDAVDNLKGVPGIGDKTAAELLKKGDLADLLEHPEKAGRWAEVLRREKERLLRDLDLATLRCQVPLDFRLEDYRIRPIQGAIEFFDELDMKMNRQLIEAATVPQPTVLDVWAS